MAKSALAILQSYQTPTKPYTGLKVTSNSSTQNSRVTVSTAPSYGLQGGAAPTNRPVAYNPQSAAAPKYTPAAYNPQAQSSAQNNAITRAASAASIVEAARQTKIAVEKAQAAQKQVLQQKFTLKVNSIATNNKSRANTELATDKFQLKVKSNSINFNIKVPERSAYDLAYDKAYKEAITEFNKNTKTNDIKGFASIWDKASFGEDRRQNGGRRWAESRLSELMNGDFSSFDKSITSYEKNRATAQDEIIRAASTFTSQAKFDAFVAGKQKELDAQYNSLISTSAKYDAMYSAYSESSEKPLSSAWARAGSNVKKVLSDENPIWRYTLGSGTKNIPSIVTAPSRVVNFVGNINTKDRDIHKYGGETANRSTSVDNAWQAGFDQRNFNIRPVIDQEFDKDKAFKFLQTKSGTDGDSYSDFMLAEKFKKANDSEKLEIAKKYWNNRNRNARNMNSAQELAADPLFFLQAAKATKLPKVFSKLGEAAKLTKPAKFLSEAASKLKSTKTLTWLNKEVVSASDEFGAAKKAIQTTSRETQAALLKKVEKTSSKLKDVPGYDLSWYDDLKKLSGKDLERFQRMTGDGKLAFRDRVALSGKNLAPARDHIEELARRYTNAMDRFKVPDGIKKTNYGLGQKHIYSPKTAWTDDLSEYDFSIFKKGKQVQSGDDFLHGVVDRVFKSNIDDVIIDANKLNTKHFKSLKNVWKEYDQSFKASKAELGIAETKLKKSTTGISRWAKNRRNVRADVSFGRASLNTANNIRQAPTRLWKKAVLSARPAWTVNNIAYNTQAAAIIGGPSALAEQAKMILKPGYWSKSMTKGAAFKGNLTSEIGKGRLSKFYSGVEDWSRVAAGNSLTRKGVSEAKALKSVNRYLFDYSIKNLERPIKAAVPFWSFQKNLLKASASLPFDKPLAAVAYNRLDKHTKQQFGKDFASVIPELESLGYSSEEIKEIEEQQAKYFRGKLKVGDNYVNTPFNAFSEKQMSQFGINPWLSAGQEAADSVDSFGGKIRGKNSSFMSRILHKFPQYTLGNQIKDSWKVNRGDLKPVDRYIGKPGSEGFGFTKEKQGYDTSKPNYVPSLDPRKNLTKNIASYFGKPGSLKFDKPKLVDSKRLQKVTQEYFDTDWNKLAFEEREASQNKLFEKFGMSADHFYKGVLSKYDTENTTRIKTLKEEARSSNQLLFDEYGKQPKGTRSTWAAAKMDSLQKEGYFKDNPYLYSFVKGAKPGKDEGWLTPENIAKTKAGAQKRTAYLKAKSSGDWSAWRKVYGGKTSEKKLAYDHAKKTGDWSAYRTKFASTSEKSSIVQKAIATGDWSAYRKKYGGITKTSEYQYNDKNFKSAESMQNYKKGEFWKKYAEADKNHRKKLLSDNPEFDERKDWTQDQWDSWKIENKKAEFIKASGFKNFAALYQRNKSTGQKDANSFITKQNYKKRRIAFRVG